MTDTKVILKKTVFLGMGNVVQPLTTEWNFHCDPEAASRVLQSMKCPVRILPWEASFFRNQYVRDFSLDKNGLNPFSPR